MRSTSGAALAAEAEEAEEPHARPVADCARGGADDQQAAIDADELELVVVHAERLSGVVEDRLEPAGDDGLLADEDAAARHAQERSTGWPAG